MRLASTAFFVTSCFLFACGENSPPPPKTIPRAPAPSPHVVLISIDALKPEYFEDPSRGAKIPALRSLMAEGAWGELESVWPTVTYPSHTTMVTGVNPSRHGILANHPFDPFYSNLDGWTWYSADITAPTLWQAAHAKHLTVGAVYWPVTVGADIDWNLPQYWRAKNKEDDKLLRVLSSPRGFAEEVEPHTRGLPSETRDDAATGDAAEYMLRAKKPDLMLVYYTDLDDAQHGWGAFSPQAYDALEKIDGQVGRLLVAAQAIGIARATTFLVVSDHGFADVDRVVRPMVAFAKAGLVDIDGGRVRDWRVGVVPAGGMCGIVLKNPNDAALRERVGQVLEDLAENKKNGIAKIDGEDDLARVEGFKGATWAIEAAPGFYFSGAYTGELVGPGANRGMHGYPPDHPDMHASIIAAGAAVGRRGEMGLLHTVDIAPTIAKILGLALPAAEGHAIAGIGEAK